jgi:hypothetical protein
VTEHMIKGRLSFHLKEEVLEWGHVVANWMRGVSAVAGEH